MDKVLYYFKEKGDTNPVGSITLENAYVSSIEQMVNDISKKFSFTIASADATYILCAESQKSMRDWVRSLDKEMQSAEQRGERRQTVAKQSRHGLPIAVDEVPSSLPSGDSMQVMLATNEIFKSQAVPFNTVSSLMLKLSREIHALKRKMGMGVRLTLEKAMTMSCASLDHGDKEGWLLKTHSISGKYKGWRKRWFVLKDDYLFYFENRNSTEPKGVVGVEGCLVKEETDAGVEFTFSIAPKASDNSKSHVTYLKAYNKTA